MELNRNDRKSAQYQLSRALQECPTDGQLWGLAIELENKSTRKGVCVDALKKTNKDPYTMLSIAKMCWREKKYAKARKWFESALILNSDLGDTWIYFYAFEVDMNEKDNEKKIIEDCTKTEPKHGMLWISIAKKPGNWRLT